jgi:hypothetical protein
MSVQRRAIIVFSNEDCTLDIWGHFHLTKAIQKSQKAIQAPMGYHPKPNAQLL